MWFGGLQRLGYSESGLREMALGENYSKSYGCMAIHGVQGFPKAEVPFKCLNASTGFLGVPILASITRIAA